jgi:crotonobetainyl-CoA:carnitine CoA-transferase CaiB-like acyl-CoA transferase
MPQQIFECRDGRIVLAVGNDGQYAKLCKVLKHPELDDERYVRNEGRVRNRDELLPLLARILAERNRTELLDELERVGVPAGPINSVPEMFEDPQAKHRGILINMDHPLSDDLRQVANPMRFSESTIVHDKHPPLLGEHTSELLNELGFDDAAIDRLKQAGVV